MACAQVRTAEHKANGYLGFPAPESQSERRRLMGFGSTGPHREIRTIALVMLDCLKLPRKGRHNECLTLPSTCLVLLTQD